jgi:hypothetical protein
VIGGASVSTPPDLSTGSHAVGIADGVYWIGALDPTLRTFD